MKIADDSPALLNKIKDPTRSSFLSSHLIHHSLPSLGSSWNGLHSDSQASDRTDHSGTRPRGRGVRWRVTLLDRAAGPGARAAGCGLGCRALDVTTSGRKGSDAHRPVPRAPPRTPPRALACLSAVPSGPTSGSSESGERQVDVLRWPCRDAGTRRRRHTRYFFFYCKLQNS